MTPLAGWARGLGDVVFPPVCVHCRGLVEGEGFRHLCAGCVREINWVRPPHCSACGHPFDGELAGERRCPHCEQLAPFYREGRTAVLVKGPARALVHEFKYHRGFQVLADMALVLRNSPGVLSLARGATLVPVPLHPRKLRERGYNQSALLADELARVAGGGTRVKPLLRRVVDTASQTHHDRRMRQANLKNAFALAPHAGFTPDQHLILVDDVFTTGSTLNSCAFVLRRAGCLKLDVITFGHG
ncbi:MAG: putative competence protein [Verrucomicrobia bacterium]|nr:putative competence protein [Verrucomicrobiota bacterium]